MLCRIYQPRVRCCFAIPHKENDLKGREREREARELESSRADLQRSKLLLLKSTMVRTLFVVSTSFCFRCPHNFAFALVVLQGENRSYFWFVRFNGCLFASPLLLIYSVCIYIYIHNNMHTPDTIVSNSFCRWFCWSCITISSYHPSFETSDRRIDIPLDPPFVDTKHSNHISGY